MRVKLFDFPASAQAVAIEDCAVLLHRDYASPIDPELNWDLWATDLCLRPGSVPPQIVRNPFFYNAQTDPLLTEHLLMSAMELTEKYSAIPRIKTKDCSISRDGGIQPVKRSAAG